MKILCLLMLLFCFKGGCFAQEEIKEPPNIQQTITSKAKFKKRIVTVSAYNPTRRQCGHSPNGKTAFGPLRDGIIAVSRDLEKAGLKPGTAVYIPGIGRKVVWDRMRGDIRNSIDVLVMNPNNKTEMKKCGMRKAEILWLAE